MNKQINVDVTKLSDLKCKCGSVTFTPVTFLKRLPGLMVGQTQDQALPVPAYQCTYCHDIFDLGKALSIPSIEMKKLT
jgi:hypothetical protein